MVKPKIWAKCCKISRSGIKGRVCDPTRLLKASLPLLVRKTSKPQTNRTMDDGKVLLVWIFVCQYEVFLTACFSSFLLQVYSSITLSGFFFIIIFLSLPFTSFKHLWIYRLIAPSKRVSNLHICSRKSFGGTFELLLFLDHFHPRLPTKQELDWPMYMQSAMAQVPSQGEDEN